jgi:hypothetical protein
LFKGKNCIGFGKNEKSAPIAISVKLRSQLETERADRDRCRTFWLEEKNCIGSRKK